LADKLLIIQVAGLGHDLLAEYAGGADWAGLPWRAAESVFPALTCPVQASFRTAAPPSQHGMMFNGVYLRPLRRPSFWEQSSALVAGPRIWERRRDEKTPSPQPSPQGRGDKSVGLLFWQQSLGEDADILLSPAPIHKHHGGMIEDVYSQPPGLYDELCRRIGRRFKLMSYWGPLASAKSSRWIAAAVAEVMRMDIAPDLLLTYLPHLDYPLLKHGPSGKKVPAALSELRDLLRTLLAAAEGAGYDVLVFGDYAFADVTRPVYPNRALHEAGLLVTRDVRGMLYSDYHASRALAVADHEVAHVYVSDRSDLSDASDALRGLDGVAEVLTDEALAEAGVAHPNAGEAVLVADEGAWFAYPWWAEKRQRPDYATHVDIHNKPGFDPCELFFGWPPPFAVSTDATKVGGSHGRVGPHRRIAYAATCDLPLERESLLGLAGAVQQHLSES
jgi:predicted AlkP superfamily pyrophosphatase or phosphodiesterase